MFGGRQSLQPKMTLQVTFILFCAAICFAGARFIIETEPGSDELFQAQIQRFPHPKGNTRKAEPNDYTYDTLYFQQTVSIMFERLMTRNYLEPTQGVT